MDFQTQNVVLSAPKIVLLHTLVLEMLQYTPNWGRNPVDLKSRPDQTDFYSKYWNYLNVEFYFFVHLESKYE